ncbi:MAG: methyltransferase domain-containing protein [Jatrophihabitantaceae bacterium]
MTRIPRVPRYRFGARVYDVVSMERLVYRSGRRAAIEALDLTPGARVLDVGCGTGLNFAYLAAAVGTAGQLVGVDASRAMLRQARRRVARLGRSTVTLVEGDAAMLDTLVAGEFDAVLFTYSLSVIGDWRTAWEQAWSLLRPGGRVAVADTSLPSGGWRLLSPLARLALLSGGVDASRQVWQQVLADTELTTHRVMTGGHVHVAVGTKPPLTARSAR